jgi:hypothetical protein
LIKNKKGNSFPIIVKCQHIIDPLSEVVYYYDDIAMPPGRSWVTCSEINPPVGEGIEKNDQKHRSRVCLHLSKKYLALGTLLNHFNTIFD